MRTYEQIRTISPAGTYEVTKLKWGGSITAGIPKAVVNTTTSALSGEASLVLQSNQTRRPAPDMFPGVIPGAKVMLEIFVDDKLTTSIQFTITDVVFTSDEVSIDFTTNTLSFSNIVRCAPVGEYMPQGWGRGESDRSERWARNLGAVSPGASPGWCIFAAMRAAGYHCVPTTNWSTTIVDIPCQWSNITEAWNPTGGHTITCFARGDKLAKTTLRYANGMTYMNSGEIWASGTVEGRKRWGREHEISGHFMWGPNATGPGEFTIITGGGNWVSFDAHPDRSLRVYTSRGTNASLPAGTIPDNGIVQVSVSTNANKWWCKVGDKRIEGEFYAVVGEDNAETKETWFTGLKVVAYTGAMFAGLQVRTGYNESTHYLDSLTRKSVVFPQTAYIDIPLTGFQSAATPAVRDQQARDVLDEIAEALCASWWVDEFGVCNFRDMKALQSANVVRSYNIDKDVADYQLSGEDTVNRDQVEVKYSNVAYSRNQRARIKVYEGRGSTISRDDSIEELITPKNNEDWLAVDWTLSWYNKGAIPESSLSENSWAACTDLEGRGAIDHHMNYVNPWTFIYRAHVLEWSTPDYSARYEVDGRKFPLIQARGLMQWTEATARYGNGNALAPFVHNGGRWITKESVADSIGNWLLGLSKNPIPMRQVALIYSPTLRLGDIIELKSGDASFTTRRLQVTQVSHEPDKLMTTVQVVEISATDTPVRTWSEAEAAARASKITYSEVQDMHAMLQDSWAVVEANPSKYPYGV